MRRARLYRYLKVCGTALAALTVLSLSGCAGRRTASGTQADSLPGSAAAPERGGEGGATVDQLKNALAYDPSNIKAAEELARRTEQRDRDAERHFQAGLALRESDGAGAKKEFLSALRIRQDHSGALEELRSLHLMSSESTITGRIKKQSAPTVKAAPEPDEDVTENHMNTALSYYEDGDYPAAIRELQHAKSQYPKDPEIARYLTLSWYNYGVSWFRKNEFQKALDAFQKVPNTFESTADYIHKCRAGLKKKAEDLYKTGLKFYREQKLQEAIKEWNAALQIDPAHQKSREYIDKARKLLDALKKRQ